MMRTFMHIPEARKARGRRLFPSKHRLRPFRGVLLPCQQHHSDLLFEYRRTSGKDSNRTRRCRTQGTLAGGVQSFKQTWGGWQRNRRRMEATAVAPDQKELADQRGLRGMTSPAPPRFAGTVARVRGRHVAQGLSRTDFMDRAILDCWFRNSRRRLMTTTTSAPRALHGESPEDRSAHQHEDRDAEAQVHPPTMDDRDRRRARKSGSGGPHNHQGV